MFDDDVDTDAMSMFLLPPAADKCQECAVDHPADWPHNPQSFFYQTKFNMEHRRTATWRDAWAHCTPEVRRQWFDLLQGAYAAAELDYRLYPEADEKRADLNESAAELLGDLVAALRQEMAVGPVATR